MVHTHLNLYPKGPVSDKMNPVLVHVITFVYLFFQSGGKDLMTGLKAKTNAGRPNWEKIFRKLQNENRGRVTVFYCGNPAVAKILRQKCEEFDFDFRKEVF